MIPKILPELPIFTVTDVLLDPSLTHGRVWLGTTTEAIEMINAKRVDIQNTMQRYVKTRYTPKLQFIQDDHYLDHMDNLFQEIQKNDAN